MATYYVSATTGNDSNDGTSVGTAKATIGAGENLATSAGDIVYIAPGTYRELVVHGYSGTSSNRIYFIGDPDCEIFGNAVKPGVVRITLAADSNEFASDGNGTTTGVVVKSNGRDYITWKNVHVDGGTGGITAYNDVNTSYGFYANSESDHMECINCLAQSLRYGFYRVGYMKHCVGIANHDYNFYFGYLAESCVSIAPAYIGMAYVDLAQNCLTLGGYYGIFYCDKAINITCVGNLYAMRQYDGDIAHDCVAIGAYYAYFGGFNTTASQNGTFSGSYATAVRGGISYYGKMHGLGFGTCYTQYVNTRDPIIGRNGSTDMQGDGLLWPQKSMLLYSMNDVNKIKQVGAPSLFSKAIQGATATVTDGEITSGTDILGNPRFMGSTLGMFNEDTTYTTSSRDLGAYELSNIEITSSVSSSQPGFSITDEGIFRIPITVSASSSVTASVGLRHSKGAGTAVKPQFQLRFSETNVTASNTSTKDDGANEYLSGSNLIIQSVTSTAADNVYETISVSGSFTKQAELELLFINQQTGSDSISTFSDLEIT